MTAVRIALERLLNQQRQPIKALAHVGMARRQPDPGTGRSRDHRRRLPFVSAFISADTVDAATAPEIRIRPPAANSISMTPAASAEDGPVRCGAANDGVAVSAATVTGLNTAGMCAGSQSCRRQRNNWLV